MLVSTLIKRLNHAETRRLFALYVAVHFTHYVQRVPPVCLLFKLFNY